MPRMLGLHLSFQRRNSFEEGFQSITMTAKLKCSVSNECENKQSQQLLSLSSKVMHKHL
jgi:hypothetical protein